ncbi:MAG: class I SAM-dependent methyltransferase [Ferruginibacter sp.]|nr:class I SAM-dependent methyltransferase [Ferruginibacter sp.]
MIQYKQCPVCLSDLVKMNFAVKDFSVSGELFEVWNCLHCTVLFTQGVPDALSIAPYYRSENYISHSDTQQGFVNWMYHKVRNYTLKKKAKLIQRVSKKNAGKLLDVGAGTGAFADAMQKSGWQVTALEPDSGAVAVARQKYKLSLQPLETLFQLSDNYDVITLWHVLEHVHDLHGYMDEFKRLLKPGGKLIIAVPNYCCRDRMHYGAYWAAWDVPRHLYHFSPLSLKILFEKHGFVCLKKAPMWFDSFYVSMLSEKYKTGRNRIIPACFYGLQSNIAALWKAEKCSSLIYIAESV